MAGGYIEVRRENDTRARILESEVGVVIEDMAKGSPVLRVMLRSNNVLTLKDETMETLFSKLAQARGVDRLHIFDTPSADALATLPQQEEAA